MRHLLFVNHYALNGTIADATGLDERLTALFHDARKVKQSKTVENGWTKMDATELLPKGLLPSIMWDPV